MFGHFDESTLPELRGAVSNPALTVAFLNILTG